MGPLRPSFSFRPYFTAAVASLLLALCFLAPMVSAYPGGRGGDHNFNTGWPFTTSTTTTTTAAPSKYYYTATSGYDRTTMIVIIVVPVVAGILLIALTILLLYLCRSNGFCCFRASRWSARNSPNNFPEDPTVYDAEYYERNAVNFPPAGAYDSADTRGGRGAEVTRQGFVIHMDAGALAAAAGSGGSVSHSPTNEQSITDHYCYTANPHNEKLGSGSFTKEEGEENGAARLKEMGSTTDGSSTQSGRGGSEAEVIVFAPPMFTTAASGDAHHNGGDGGSSTSEEDAESDDVVFSRQVENNGNPFERKD